MAGVRVGRMARRARFALITSIPAGWVTLSALPASAHAAAGTSITGHPAARQAVAAGPVDHKSTNILFEVLVGVGILVVVWLLVHLITRGRGRGNPGSGGGGRGGGGGFGTPRSTPPGGRHVEKPAGEEKDEDKASAASPGPQPK